jgi:hypothetical protein
VGEECLGYHDALAVFDAVRDWQCGLRISVSPSAPATGTRARKLPDTAAGWLLPLAGEPAETDGSRPIPALRRELRLLCDRAGLTPAEKVVLTAYAGLHVYPSNRESPIDPISRRVPRIRSRDQRPLDASSVHRIRRGALEKAARLMPPRRSRGVVIVRAATDPLSSPWMLAVLAELRLTRHEFVASEAFGLAAERARDLVSVGDIPDDRAASSGNAQAGERAGQLTLLREIDRLTARYQRTGPRAGSVNARELARARAALASALFEIYYGSLGVGQAAPRAGPPNLGKTRHQPRLPRAYGIQPSHRPSHRSPIRTREGRRR